MAKEPTPEVCGLCRWWVQTFRDKSHGTCWRYPPTVPAPYPGAVATPQDSTRPVTDETDYCGEWTKKAP